MSKSSASIDALPPRVLAKIEDLGRRIKLARKRRGLTLNEMARLMMISVGSLRRLENGTPGTSIGTLATALLTLGLENDMDNVAAMETDMIGLAHERRRLAGKADDKNKISYDF
ncbi:MAG: helix-turn-helix transcriptional regulator [Desulfovibrio sp.]